jgi:FkbM family methyltransferase
MIQRPASSDPAEITRRLWAGWHGVLGFDVGANCGQSVATMLDLFDRVVAFEPAEESRELLVRDYGLDDRVSLVSAAVSQVGGRTDLWETPGNLAQGQLISPGHHAFTRECEPAPRPVPCITLDVAAEEFGRPDFVKVDTEGHELLILQGAPGLVKAGCGWLIEFHSPAMHDGCEGILLQAGYRVETVRHPHYPPGTEDWYNHGWLRAEPAAL